MPTQWSKQAHRDTSSREGLTWSSNACPLTLAGSFVRTMSSSSETASLSSFRIAVQEPM